MRQGLAIVVAIGLLLAPSASAKTLDKLDARLAQLATGKRAKIAPGGASVRPVGAPVRRGRVLVDVYVRGAMRDGAAVLRREGMQVQALSGRSPQRMVEGWVPVDRLDDIAALRTTRAVVSVVEPIYNTGGTLSEGDAAHNGPQVRALGFTGQGIPVGVMSDSINKRGTGVAGSQATDDLPPTVEILDEPGSGTDEGRAMAEIVYDEAPGIPKIIFARGTGGPAVRATNIAALVNAGAKVIADDVVYLTEPFFQDGIIAQAADQAKANGTAYFASAGNRARQSWEGTFTPSGVTPTENDFDPGAGDDTKQTIATVPASQSLTIFVQWGEPIGAVTDDFALDFYNLTTPGPPQTLDSPNVISGIPTEAASLPGGAGGTTWAMTIRRVSGSGTPRLKWIANGSFTGALPAEFAPAHTIDPDAASARGALAVAAVRHNDVGLDTAEVFSSRGPSVTRLFDANGSTLATPDVRPKPDIAAADGVATTVDGTVGGPDLNPFFGTSAAAPSAAGVAALLLSAKPSLSVDQLYAILRDPRGSIDCTSAAGFPDADCGSGFILADGKLALALDSTPPSATAATSPGSPDGANGWFHGDVGVTWTVEDAESPIGAQSGCDPQTVTSDGATAFTCTATSAGGTVNQPVTIRRDTAPPAPPAFSGIAPGATFTTLNVPAQDAIGCSSSDATSGVASCVVTGFSNAIGSHTLTATATDQSGLTSSSTLSYAVAAPPPPPRPAGARSLAVTKKQTLRSVLKSGFKFTANVGAAQTALVATLKDGRKTCGRLKATRGAGRASLKITPTKACKKRLRKVRKKTRFALTLKASGPNVVSSTVNGAVTLKP